MQYEKRVSRDHELHQLCRTEKRAVGLHNQIQVEKCQEQCTNPPLMSIIKRCTTACTRWICSPKTSWRAACLRSLEMRAEARGREPREPRSTGIMVTLAFSVPFFPLALRRAAAAAALRCPTRERRVYALAIDTQCAQPHSRGILLFLCVLAQFGVIKFTDISLTPFQCSDIIQIIMSDAIEDWQNSQHFIQCTYLQLPDLMLLKRG